MLPGTRRHGRLAEKEDRRGLRQVGETGKRWTIESQRSFEVGMPCHTQYTAAACAALFIITLKRSLMSDFRFLAWVVLKIPVFNQQTSRCLYQASIYLLHTLPVSLNVASSFCLFCRRRPAGAVYQSVPRPPRMTGTRSYDYSRRKRQQKAVRSKLVIVHLLIM